MEPDAVGTRSSLGVSGAKHRLMLVVMSPSGTGHVALPERGTLVLGRASECDVGIDDAKLSRRHAEIRCGEQLAVVDLGSRNGTYVREERVEPDVPRALRVGDAITIGSTMIVVQSAKSAGDRPRHVWSHGYFEARLEDECARAARDRRSFAVLRLRLQAPSSNDATKDHGTMTASLFAALEQAEMVACYAPREYEALFLDVTPAEADARAEELARSLATTAASRVVVAAYPRDGRGPQALIEHTSRGLKLLAGGGAATATTPPAPLGALQRMAGVIARVAAGAINVLILGETGVGKEVLARRLHGESPRAKMPLVSINCAALSESLLESELFGHEKGAFTGAIATKAGLLESANGGVVFLDEIGEMPLATQAKLLRVLEQREITRVGAVRSRPIDVRFFAATNRDLEEQIALGRFRRDLFFRLNGIALSLPPLRERTDEIEPLAVSFVAQACRAMARADRPSIAPDALEALRRYAWPGNIRELRNAIERAVLLCSGDVITRDHLPMEKMGPTAQSAASPTAPPEPHDERQRIVAALEKCAGSQSKAAKLLGISRATLIRRLDEYGLPRPRKCDL